MTDLPPDDPADDEPGADVPPVTRPAYPAPGTPPSSWRYRAFVAAALAVAAGALYLGVRATETESDDPITINGRPEVVEHLYPRNGAEVLRRFAHELRDAGSTLKVVATEDRVISQLATGGLTADIGAQNVYRGTEWVGEGLRRAYADARGELRGR